MFLQSLPILRSQISVSPPDFALRMLQVDKQLLQGKKLAASIAKASSAETDLASVREEMKEVKEQCMLSVLEDVQDASVVNRGHLLSVAYLLEEQGQDEETSEETQLLADILYE